MNITFLGATQTVTGSKYLIEADQKKYLIDCGLFQGRRELRDRNWNKLPINPSEIHAVFLTHAHLDHSGYLPLLVKNGFRGKIFCTEATRDLCDVILRDSGFLQEEEARYANRKGYSKHKPALPLYTHQDAEEALKYFEVVTFNKPIQLSENFKADFHYGGHILGASTVRLQHYEIAILFSGDLGRAVDPILYPPKPPALSNYLVIESTYGNRLHDKEDPEATLEKIILRTVKRQGVILIPAFAVGRAQNILYYIYQLKLKRKIPDIPVYIDSPMTVDATKIFYKYADHHRLGVEEAKAVCRTAQFTHSVEESMTLDENNDPKIIISASGMAEGGRILHHIKKFAPLSKNTIIFCGYQANGTRGDRIVRGEKEVRIFGQMVPIEAEIQELHNMSAHADYEEMLAWLSQLQTTPRKVFITHGESDSAEELKKKIEEKFQWVCEVPAYLHSEELV